MVNMKTGLATEEMQDCPTCSTPTFNIGPCFACSAKTGGEAGPWSKVEITAMTAFARGFVTGWLDRPGDEPLDDHWVTYDEDIDLHFYREDELNADLQVFGYRRPVRDGDQKCEDEIRLI